MLAEATVKVERRRRASVHTAADGNGPVNALDAALRKALERVLPGDRRHPAASTTRCASSTAAAATAARTRVHHRLGATGHGRGARWAWTPTSSRRPPAALADSLEYAIWKAGSELRRRDERHFTTTRTEPVRSTTASPSATPRR